VFRDIEVVRHEKLIHSRFLYFVTCSFACGDFIAASHKLEAIPSRIVGRMAEHLYCRGSAAGCADLFEEQKGSGRGAGKARPQCATNFTTKMRKYDGLFPTTCAAARPRLLAGPVSQSRDHGGRWMENRFGFPPLCHRK
jgi:hypothetical protein